MATTQELFGFDEEEQTAVLQAWGRLIDFRVEGIDLTRLFRRVKDLPSPCRRAMMVGLSLGKCDSLVSSHKAELMKEPMSRENIELMYKLLFKLDEVEE